VTTIPGGFRREPCGPTGGGPASLGAGSIDPYVKARKEKPRSLRYLPWFAELALRSPSAGWCGMQSSELKTGGLYKGVAEPG